MRLEVRAAHAAPATRPAGDRGIRRLLRWPPPWRRLHRSAPRGASEPYRVGDAEEVSRTAVASPPPLRWRRDTSYVVALCDTPDAVLPPPAADAADLRRSVQGLVRIIHALAERERAGDAAVLSPYGAMRSKMVYRVTSDMLHAAAASAESAPASAAPDTTPHLPRRPVSPEEQAAATERVFQALLRSGSESGSTAGELLEASQPRPDRAAPSTSRRERLLIKTTDVPPSVTAADESARGRATAAASLHRPASSPAPESVASDLAHGARFAIGLERYVAASELAAAARMGITGAMHAADGYYHDEMDYLRQFDLEEKAVEQAVQRYRVFAQSAIQRGDVALLKPTQRLLLSWYHPLVMNIVKEQEAIRQQIVSLDRNKYGPYLLLLKPEVFAVLAIHETLAQVLQDKSGASFTRAALAIGRAVQAEYHALRLRQLQLESRKAEQQPQADRGVEYVLRRARRTASPRTVIAINAAARRMELESALWDDRVVAKIGSCLIHLLLRSARVVLPPATPEGEPAAVFAFQHVYRPAAHSRHQIGIIELHEAVQRLLVSSGPELRDTLLPRYQPMLVPPRPWTSYNRGGYLRPRGLVMRLRGGRRHLEALKHSDLSEVFAGLNALGATPWRINRPVLEVVERLWQRGGDIAGLVPRADLPPPPLEDIDDIVEEEAVEAGDATERVRRQRRAERRVRKTNRERHALRCDLMYKLQTAREFADVERFYLPHNLDFRGRAYPIPPLLNHMGSDVCRALLQFATPGRPLGERGIFWLKVHLANLCGRGKTSLSERVAFAESVMPQALAVARDPLSDAHLQWWATQEDPFQLLATCFEFAACNGGRDPHVVSTFPVHQDGSCNGLQHYAALGRDEVGAAQVNLVPSDRPQDVYAAVAAVVRERIAAAAREGNPTAQLLDGRISRKVVKQTVMTSVYGVTYCGAREQIQNRLRELPGMPPERLWEASQYAARQTLLSLGDLFRGATDTMEWLAECAARIASSRYGDGAVHWVTPLGLPVVQPYRQRECHLVNTVVQKVLLAEDNEALPVSRARQRSAFPPNYVHSLDSSHMLMTAVECRRQGIPFAAVHDSFWTHPSQMDRLNAILRHRFVHLHTRDLLTELLEHFRLHFPDIAFPEVPPRGQLDLRVVLDSPYFFS
ncbi:hypothetical protein CDCA_CDCA09G2819 [Cyanidium caldarium]|uniref:DNA-directed RNA polymerase n=1 Tax=Cyanidium caldarium TaxID=2771 RepID=A0AAV9IXG3_CYACA|nr:hypothetical protein CDCA_CDCA09G2819 [Cyanidium caldarium]